MGNIRKRWMRVLSLCLCGCMMIGYCTAPLQTYAVTRDDAEFMLFLAEYLDHNYVYEKENEIVENLEQVMVHHVLHEAMEQQGVLADTAVTLQNMANNWGYALDGKRMLYEQLLLEFVRNYLESDLFLSHVEEGQERVEAELLDTARTLFDVGNTVKDSAEVAERASKMDISTWEDVLRLPKEYVLENIGKLAAQYELPVSSCLLEFGFDTWEFMLEVSLYLQLKDQVEGIRSVIEEIYRTTDNEDLMVAAFHILNKLDAASSEDFWKVVTEAASTGYASNVMTTMMKELVMMLLNVLGIEIEVLGIITNVLFNLDTLAEAQLLLDVETEIEYVLKKIIRTKQNAYKNNIKNSRILVLSVMMLYEAYEYGLDIARNYGDAFFEANKNVVRLNSFSPKSFFKNDEEITCTQNEFASYLKTSDGILTTNRTIFYSGWLEYRKLYPGNHADSLMDYMGKTYASGLKFSQPTVVMEYEADGINTQSLKAPEMTPEGAIALPVRYESSDPSVLSFGSESVNIVRLHQPGSVTVTATTEDGYYSASQQIIVKEKTSAAEGDWEPETAGTYNSNCYKENEDGITVTRVISDCVDMEDMTYRIPSEIDGKPVTEVDFSECNIFAVSTYLNVPEGYQMEQVPQFDSFGRGHIEYNGSIYVIRRSLESVETIVLPDTVKRIADNCFMHPDSGWGERHSIEVILNEGLEVVGENALQYRSLTPEVTLPTSVKKIGKGALDIRNVETIYLQCLQLEEIPEACFIGQTDRHGITSGRGLAPKKNVVFLGDHKNLTGVGTYGLARVRCVNLPDSIEKADDFAFWGSFIEKFPEALKEIGEKCFYGAEISCNRLPKTVKTIGRGAFQNARYEELQIPNSVELIAEEAFWNDKQSVVIRTYGDAAGAQNGVLEGAFDSNLSYLEIPESIRTIQDLFSGDGGKHTQVVWTDALNRIGIKNPNNPKRVLSVYLKEMGNKGNFGFDEYFEIFGHGTYYEYIEIPSNYLDNTKESMTGSHIKEAVIVGTEDEEKLEGYVEILKGVIEENGKISYKNKDGEKVLLYIKHPLYYVKESQAKYENQEDYLLDSLELYENQSSDTVADLNICVSVPYGEKGDHELSKPELGCWVGRDEDAVERAEQLGDYMIFEDLYLRQNGSRYFTVDLESDSSAGRYSDYALSVDIKYSGLTAENVGLYHINENGKITRLPVSLEEAGITQTIKFHTKELGQFVLVKLENLETKVWSLYRDELHDLYNEESEEKHVSADAEAVRPEDKNLDDQGANNQGADDQDSDDQGLDDQDADNQNTDDQDENRHVTIFVDADQEDGTITIRKPELSREERDALVEMYPLGEKITDSLMEVTTTEDQKKIYVAVNLTENQKQKTQGPKVQSQEAQEQGILVFMTNENGILDQDRLLPEANIKKLDSEEVSETIIRPDSAYYEVELREAGVYYIAAEETDEIQIRTSSELDRKLLVFGIIGFLLGAGILLTVVGKKRR